MTATPDEKLITKPASTVSPCEVCGKTLSSSSSLKRHRTHVHGLPSASVELAAVSEPVAVEERETVEPTPALAVKPFYKKKRWYIPAAVFVGLVAVGAVTPA